MAEKSILTRAEYWLARGHDDGLDDLPKFYHDCPGMGASGCYPVIATFGGSGLLPLATILQGGEVRESRWGLDTTGQEYTPIPIAYCPFCGLELVEV